MLITFTIYCNGDRADPHEQHEVKKLIFAPFPDGSFDWTTPADGLRVGDTRPRPDFSPDWLDQADGDAARWRRSYRCNQCGYSVTARDEKFRPIVDRLLRHGVSRLSLAGLSTMLDQR